MSFPQNPRFHSHLHVTLALSRRMLSTILILRSNHRRYSHRHLLYFLTHVHYHFTSPETTVTEGGGRRRSRKYEMCLLYRLPLSLPSPLLYRHSHHHNSPRRQTPSLLPRSPLSPRLPPQVRPLNPRYFSSEASDLDENPPSDGGHDDVVSRVCKIVGDLFSPNDRNMEAVLDQCCSSGGGSGILTTEVVVEVLDRFRHAHKPAHRFFRWASCRPEFDPNCKAYNKMLLVLGKTRQFETMVMVLDEMKKAGSLDPESFRIAVTMFAAAREMKKAIGAFKLMEKSGFDVGIESLNLFLVVLAKEKLGKEAQQLFDRMRDRMKPNLKTYTVLLSGWCKLKNLVEAGRIWNEMVDDGFKPDVIAYNVMLQGLIMGQRRPEAIKLFELMKAKGPRPEVSTYNVLIQDLCKRGKMDDAADCFQEMIEDGLAPDEVTYTLLIVGFGKAKRMEEVPGLLKEMQEMGCPLDGKTYNVLIKLMTNYRRSEDALTIYKRMIKNGISPTVHTYNMMMKCYFHENNVEMAFGLWEEMKRMGVCPDDNSYTVLIGGLIRHGNSEEALKYMEEMINIGMKAPIFDYGKFAADFARSGRPDVLYELAQKMSFSGKSRAADVFLGLAERLEKGLVRKGLGGRGW